jgi:hypothetical protein
VVVVVVVAAVAVHTAVRKPLAHDMVCPRILCTAARLF